MFRTVDCAMWSDPWFADLEPNAKLVFVYLFTNPRTTPCGGFEITVRQIAFDTGIDAGIVCSVLDGLAPKVQWWPQAQVVWLRNFYRRQAGNSNRDNYRKAARTALAELPKDVYATVIHEYPELAIPTGYPTPTHTQPIDKGSPSHTQDTNIFEEEQQQEEEQARRAAAAANGAHPREKPPLSLYAKTLNGALPTLESMFQRIDQLFTPGWLAKELADAEAVVGSLSKEQLGRGLDIAVKQIERQMAAKAVRNPRPFAHKLIVDYLTEQREGHHAT